jgi:hypothetical protein
MKNAYFIGRHAHENVHLSKMGFTFVSIMLAGGGNDK